MCHGENGQQGRPEFLGTKKVINFTLIIKSSSPWLTIWTWCLSVSWLNKQWSQTTSVMQISGIYLYAK